MATWSIGFDKLLVNNADEDGGGDEVYLALIAFRAKLGIPGSTKTWLNEWRNRTWAENVKQDAQRNIPAPVGRAIFNNVQDFDFTAFSGSRDEPNNPAFRPEVLGIISIAMEYDNSSLASIQPLMNKAKDAVHGEVEKIIAKETTPLIKLTAQQMSDKLKGSAKTISDAVKPSLLESLAIFAEAWTDPDDFVDYKIDWFTDLSPNFVACFQGLKEANDAKAGKPLPPNQSEAALIARSGLNPVRAMPLSQIYQNKGVKYTLSGSVVKTTG